ncbi:MAG: hypothetical protein ABIT76_07280 [Chthoniobacterales bacterium]
MEYHQAIQNRTQQTVAVINAHVPTMQVGLVTAADLTTQSNALNGLALTRDSRLADYDGAVNAEAAGFNLLRKLSLALPQSATGELDEEVPAEAKLLNLLDAVYSINPNTTEAATQRAQKTKAALLEIDPYLTGLVPPRNAITSGGRGLPELTAALDAQPDLEQNVETEGA